MIWVGIITVTLFTALCLVMKYVSFGNMESYEEETKMSHSDAKNIIEENELLIQKINEQQAKNEKK